MREPDHVHKRSLPGNRSWALCKCVFFFGVLRKKGSNYKRTTEKQMEKLREIAGRGQPEKCGPRCHVAAEIMRTNKQKVRPRESLLADRSRRSHLLHLCAREMMFFKVENNSFELTRISASLSLFSALTLYSHAHLWSIKLSQGNDGQQTMTMR